MPELSTAKTSDDARKTFWRTLRLRTFRWLERALAIFGALTLLYLLLFDVSVMVSGSMSPALRGTNADDGDHIVTEKFTKWFRSPRRWEVIAFRNSEGSQVMKRVVGLPGETVQLEKNGGPLLINGQPIEMPAWLGIHYLGYGNLCSDCQAVQCGTGYYVLGDDTKDSDDSRYNGPVQPKRIIGRAWLIMWPLSRFGFVQ
jgi:signal peptidase I